MHRVILLCVLFAVALPVFALPAKAVAAEEKILDATIERYRQEASKWEPRIKQAATRMFWILATISLVFTFGYMFLRGTTSLGDFFGELVRFTITTGFFYWLLDNGSEISRSVLTSFAQLGREASSSYQGEMSPTNLLWFALDLVVRSCASFGEQDIATSVVALLLSIAIAVLFAIVAAMMVQLLCAAWVLVYAGIIYLGFGGGRWTTDIAINYFKTVLGLGIQTFVFCLLAGIGQQQVERLITQSTQMKTVEVKGIFRDSIINTTAMTITEACIILVFTVVLFMLLKTVPQLVAGIVSGSSTGGIHLGGTGSAIGAAAAVASGGAMIAMQMAGGYMALNSAYQQSTTNMAEGMGKFEGGGFGGGLSGAMSKGLTFASDMMSNIVSGARDAAGENLQRSTTGGAVSAHIDNNNATNLANKAAADAEGAATKSDSTDGTAGGGSGGGQGVSPPGGTGGGFSPQPDTFDSGVGLSAGSGIPMADAADFSASGNQFDLSDAGGEAVFDGGWGTRDSGKTDSPDGN